MAESITPPRRKNSGFTLIEMLIVVAIIAILIAVSIPMVSSALERARCATDAANERAFKAELLICYLNGYDNDGAPFVNIDASTSPKTYAYDAANGKLTDKVDKGYGKCTQTGKHASMSGGTINAAHDGKVLYGGVTAAGDVWMAWGDAGTTPSVTSDGSTLHGMNVS